MFNQEFKNGSWKHCDDTYTIIGLDVKSNKIILEKSVRFGIYYTDIRVSRITRKLSKDNKIKLAGFTFDLSEVPGIKT